VLPALILLLATADDASLRRMKGDVEMPPGLSCLSKYYAGRPAQTDAGWAWELPDGGTLAWDDGRPHTRDEETADPPDLEELFATPYVPGPIVPVNGEGEIEDPGRVRVEQLFLATYGSNRSEVMEHLGKIKFFGVRYRFHEKAIDALERVVERLQAALKENPKLLPFFTDIGGTWQWRTIARSKNLSTHAWGIAIDLNVERGYYWRWQRPKLPLKWRNKVPQPVVDAFEAEGFIWGGRWLHYDTMHFEYRPELLDADCRPPPSPDAGH
jgi:hypothetical protein